MLINVAHRHERPRFAFPLRPRTLATWRYHHHHHLFESIEEGHEKTRIERKAARERGRKEGIATAGVKLMRLISDVDQAGLW